MSRGTRNADTTLPKAVHFSMGGNLLRFLNPRFMGLHPFISRLGSRAQ